MLTIESTLTRSCEWHAEQRLHSYQTQPLLVTRIWGNVRRSEIVQPSHGLIRLELVFD